MGGWMLPLVTLTSQSYLHWGTPRCSGSSFTGPGGGMAADSGRLTRRSAASRLFALRVMEKMRPTLNGSARMPMFPCKRDGSGNTGNHNSNTKGEKNKQQAERQNRESKNWEEGEKQDQWGGRAHVGKRVAPRWQHVTEQTAAVQGTYLFVCLTFYGHSFADRTMNSVDEIHPECNQTR